MKTKDRPDDLLRAYPRDKEGLIESKEQEDILMDIADIVEPGWHRKWNDNNPNREQHWLYKLVRTKLFRLLK